MTMQLLLLLLSVLAMATAPDPATLMAARRRRQLGCALAALLALLALAGPYWVDWRRESSRKAAIQVLHALHKAEVRYQRANGAYARLDRLRATGESPVNEGGTYQGHTFTSVAGSKEYAIYARPSWSGGESYTMDESGILNRPPRARREPTPAERLETARAAVKARPAEAAGWVRLATALLGMKRDEDALSAARHAASIDRAAAAEVLREALLVRGGALLDAGKAREALPFLREIARRGSSDPDALALIGDAYRALGREDDALAAYRTAAQAGPASARAWYGMARILEARGRKQEAARAYLRVVNIGDEIYVQDTWIQDSMKALERLRGTLAPE